MTLRDRLAEAARQRELRTASAGRCVFAERMVTGCCEREYRCHKTAERPIFGSDRCHCECPDFKEQLMLSAVVIAANRAAREGKRVPGNVPQLMIFGSQEDKTKMLEDLLEDAEKGGRPEEGPQAMWQDETKPGRYCFS